MVNILNVPKHQKKHIKNTPPRFQLEPLKNTGVLIRFLGNSHVGAELAFGCMSFQMALTYTPRTISCSRIRRHSLGFASFQQPR